VRLHWTDAVRRLALLILDLPAVKRERLARKLERGLEISYGKDARGLLVDLTGHTRDRGKERELERLFEDACTAVLDDSAVRLRATMVDFSDRIEMAGKAFAGGP